ncbi:MAG: hypothetical protein ACFFD4_00455 [Candidatus Odinarchaeota archaeon]
MKTVLYLDQENIDLTPFGTMEDLLGFKVAGKPVIQHFAELLATSGIKDSLLVTIKQDIAGEEEKYLDSILKSVKSLSVDIVPVTSLYALIQDIERVLLFDGLVFPSKQDLKSLLDSGKEQLPVKLSSTDGQSAVPRVFLLDKEPSPATIDFSGIESGKAIYETITEHLSVQGVSFLDFKAREPVLLVEKTWQLLDLQEILMKTMTLAENSIEGNIEPGAYLKGGGIVIKEGATIRSGSYIIGPTIIEKNAVTGPNCYIRPYTFIDRNVVIGNAVEIKNSIILEGTHVGHLSYVGDSIIGKECNFGAGTKIANLKFSSKTVKASSKNSEEKISTGRRKLGVMMGHGVKTGINSSLMPGIKLGQNSVIGAGFLLQEDIESEHQIYLDENQKPIEKKRKTP